MRTQQLFRLMVGVMVALAITAMSSAEQVRAQDGHSTAEGVYTDAQATRGEMVYAASCAACHGADLNGTNVIPGLIGPGFESFWRGQPLGDLFEKISATMPKSEPGSLTPEQNADVLAYLLHMLEEPAGSAELAPEPDMLGQVTISAAE